MTSVDLSVAHPTVLDRALATLGWTRIGTTINTDQGSFTIVGNAAQVPAYMLPEVNLLRVTYAKEAVAFAAKQFGWQKVQKSPVSMKMTKGM